MPISREEGSTEEGERMEEVKRKRGEGGSNVPWILVNHFCYILNINPYLAQMIYNMSQALKYR